MPGSREKTRNTLVETAHRLFYDNGYRATGVDRIAEEAGLTKKTLYSHFPAKTALIVAALAYRDESYLMWLEAHMAKTSGPPEARFAALLEAVGHWIETRGQHGCMFVNALAEFDAGEDSGAEDIREAVSAHKNRVADYLERLAREASLEAPASAVAWRVSLLMEGMVSMARFQPVDLALAHARTLLPAAIASPSFR